MMNNILSAKTLDDPWQHCVIDEVFDNTLWSAVHEAATLMAPHIEDGAYSIDLIEALDYGVPQSTIDMIVDYSDSLLGIHKEVIGKFSHMSFSKYGYINDIRWSFAKNCVWAIHDDKANLNKIMTFVIYVSPEQDTGTLLYTHVTPESYHSTINWNPNSGMLFCPEHEVTWHTYKAGDTPRITLNIYYHSLDPWFDDVDFQQNALAKQRISRIKWVKSMFEQGKLYRSNREDLFEIFKIFNLSEDD